MRGADAQDETGTAHAALERMTIELAQLKHQMATFLDRADERRDLGRALVEERARNLHLQRQLFDAEQRAVAAEGKLVELGTEAKRPESSLAVGLGPILESAERNLAALGSHIEEAQAAGQSLLGSRLLRAAKLASAAPLVTAGRVTSALDRAKVNLELLRQVQHAAARLVADPSRTTPPSRDDSEMA